MAKTVEDWANQYVTTRRRRGEISSLTANNYRVALGSFARHYGKRDPAKCGRKAVEKWLETTGHHQPSTRRAELSRVVNFLRWLQVEGVIGRKALLDMPRLRKPRVQPRALNALQVAKLLRETRRHDARTRAIIAAQLWDGLRCIEVSRLRIEDWDRTAHTLWIVGKGGHTRTVHCPPPVEQALSTYLAEEPATNGPMFRHAIGCVGVELTPQWISTLVIQLMYDAEVKVGPRDGVGPHALRHTAASDMLDASGGDVRLVQSFLGHQSLETTAGYLRAVSLEAMRDAMTKREYPGAA